MFGFMMAQSGSVPAPPPPPPQPTFDPGYGYATTGFHQTPVYDWHRVLDKWDFSAETSSVVTDMLQYGHSGAGAFGNLTEALWAGGQDFDGVNSRNPTSYVDKFTYSTETIAPGTVILSPVLFGPGDYGAETGWSSLTTGLFTGANAGQLYDYSGQTWTYGGLSGYGPTVGTNAFAIKRGNTVFDRYIFSSNTTVATQFRFVTQASSGDAFGDANTGVFFGGSSYLYSVETCIYADEVLATIGTFGFGAGEIPSTSVASGMSNAAEGICVQGQRNFPAFSTIINNVVKYSFQTSLWSSAGTMQNAASEGVGVATVPGGLSAAVYSVPGTDRAGTQFTSESYGDGYGSETGNPVAYCGIELPNICYEVNGLFMLAQVQFDLIDGTGQPQYYSIATAGYTINTPPGWTFIRRDNADFLASCLYWKFSEDESPGSNSIPYTVTTNMSNARAYSNSIVVAYTHVNPSNPINSHTGATAVVLRTAPAHTINLSLPVANAYDRVLISGATTVISSVLDSWPNAPKLAVANNGPDAIFDRLALSPGTFNESVTFNQANGAGNRPMIAQAVSLNRGYSPFGLPFPVTAGVNQLVENAVIPIPIYAQGQAGLLMIAVVVFNTMNASVASGFSMTTPAGWTLVRSDTTGPIVSYVLRKLSSSEPANYPIANTFQTGVALCDVRTLAYDQFGTVFAHASAVGASGSPNTIIAPSVNLSAANDILICAVAWDANMQNAATSPATMKQWQNGFGNQLYDEHILASPSGTRTFTFNGTDANVIAQSISIT